MANPTKISTSYANGLNLDGYLRRKSDGKVYEGGAGGDGLWHVWTGADVIKYAMAYTFHGGRLYTRAFPDVQEKVEYVWDITQRLGIDAAVNDAPLGSIGVNEIVRCHTDLLGTDAVLAELMVLRAKMRTAVHKILSR